MAQWTWDAHSHKGSPLVLYSAVQLREKWNFNLLLEACDSELQHLSSQFGFRLRRPVLVYLLPSVQDIAYRLHPKRVGGFAIGMANAIVIAADIYTTRVLRHELAHLFSARLNPLAPPLLNEGLSVWFERQDGPVDLSAREILRNHHGLRLSALLKSKFFYAEENLHKCYSLAGSFTTFLILYFGWDPYVKFFQKSGTFLFAKEFWRHFGIPLDVAEERWRRLLLG